MLGVCQGVLEGVGTGIAYTVCLHRRVADIGEAFKGTQSC